MSFALFQFPFELITSVHVEYYLFVSSIFPNFTKKTIVTFLICESHASFNNNIIFIQPVHYRVLLFFMLKPLFKL